MTRKTNSSLTAILYLNPKKRCSFHQHKTAFNQFFVITGSIGVKTDIGPEGEIQVAQLNEGDTFVVPPGIRHEFQTYAEPAIVEEIAYVEYDPSDIYRERLGGNLNEQT